MLRSLSLFGLLGLAACAQDYGIKDQQTGNVSADDTGTPVEEPDETVDSGEPEPPPDCADFPAPAVDEPGKDDSCQVALEPLPITPVVEWQWTQNEVYPYAERTSTPPLVAQLTDDNGDGAVDGADVPDVLIGGLRDNAEDTGFLTALSGEDGTQLWAVSELDGVSIGRIPYAAVGDLEGDGVPEICVAGHEALLLCLDTHDAADPTLRWAVDAPVAPPNDMDRVDDMPYLADLDGDGRSEIIMAGDVFSPDGDLLLQTPLGRGYSPASTSHRHAQSYAVDWDEDGDQDIVVGDGVFTLEGDVLMQTGDPDGRPAVADLDGDGTPELVVLGGNEVRVYDTDGSLLWSDDPGLGCTNGQGDRLGPPVVADLDGDGLPELGTSGCAAFHVYDGDGTPLWDAPVEDTSSAVAGAAAFDFEGDGPVEVVYADEEFIRVLRGTDGSEVWSTDLHRHGTRMEYPTIADVDGDGQSELLVGHQGPLGTAQWRGMTVLGAGDGNPWAPAPAHWQQHVWMTGAVGPDNRIPATVPAPWTTHNSLRQAFSEEATRLADRADLFPGEPAVCTETCADDTVTLYLPVLNSGLLDGETVSVVLTSDRDGVPTEVGRAELPLVTAGLGAIAGPLELSAAAWGEGLTARIDLEDTVEECDEDDNTVELGAFPCD